MRVMARSMPVGRLAGFGAPSAMRDAAAAAHPAKSAMRFMLSPLRCCRLILSIGPRTLTVARTKIL
jgi:hypothetical protein